MAAPWEKYQKAETTQETGPWSKFQKAKADPDRSFEVPTAQNLAIDRARPVQPPEPRIFAKRAQERCWQHFSYG
jgi:hypothetical protein